MTKKLNEDVIGRLTAWKLLGETSCIGCKFLYFRDSGYSNYTVENTDTICALNKNPLLPADAPYDWENREGKDNWPNTNAGRCESYEHSDITVHLDVDGENTVEEQTGDQEVIDAINGNY